MATPFDATTKELVRYQPEDWLALLGLPPAPCELVDADLATVSTEADRLIRVNTASPYLVHIEFQAGHDGHRVPGRMLRYNVLAGEQTGLVTLSYVILLRPEADSPALTGKVERFRPNNTPYLNFEYDVIRLWDMPVKAVLQGGMATLPMALLCDLSETTPEWVVSQMEQRIEKEAQIENRRKLWASTYLLAGVRFAPEIATTLLEKAVAQMKESSTYQKILADGRLEGIETGRLEGEREAFLRIASHRLGQPDKVIREIIEKATLPRLQVWMDNVLETRSWQELLGM
jgi:predicted transposase YdaD